MMWLIRRPAEIGTRHQLAATALPMLLLIAACSGGTNHPDGAELSELEAGILLTTLVQACEAGEARTSGGLSPALTEADDPAMVVAGPVPHAAAVEGPYDVLVQADDDGAVTITAKMRFHLDALFRGSGSLVTFAVDQEITAQATHLDGTWVLSGWPTVVTTDALSYTGCPGAAPAEQGIFAMSWLVQSGREPVPTTRAPAAEPGQYGIIGTPLMSVAPEDWVQPEF
jgi:hypothetical protein